jgi:hypothetical protein
MFKCKIDITTYDKNAKEVPNAELPKTKNLSKAAVKKLASKLGEKTNFYLAKDYFENKGKPVGHFLAFGISKKLAKHFIMNEMKGKGSSGDAKSAATGEVSIKKIDGKDKLVFEPHAKCKIPAGQWPKLLKSLKTFLGGYKAVVSVNGQMIEEEPLLPGEVEEVDDTPAGEEETFEDAKAESEADEDEADEKAPSDAKNNNQIVVDEIKNLIKSIGGEMKNNISSVIVPNIKSKKVSDKDLSASVNLLSDIDKLKALYNSAEDKVKSALAEHVDKIVAFAPKLEQIKSAIEKILPSLSDAVKDAIKDVTNGATEVIKGVKKVSKEYIDSLPENQNDSWFEDLLKSASKTYDTIVKDIDKVETAAEAAAKAASSAIKSGADLINDLF